MVTYNCMQICPCKWHYYTTYFYEAYMEGKINCPYCPGYPTACTDKWNFSKIRYINIIRTIKKMLQVKKEKQVKIRFYRPWSMNKYTLSIQ